MTPCEELGYKVGDKFIVTIGLPYLLKGSEVTLLTDDGSESPFFESDSAGPLHLSIRDVKPVPKYREGDKVLVSGDGEYWREGIYISTDRSGRHLIASVNGEYTSLLNSNYGAITYKEIKPLPKKVSLILEGKEYKITQEQADEIREKIS